MTFRILISTFVSILLSQNCFAQKTCYCLDNGVFNSIGDLSQYFHRTADYIGSGARVRVDELSPAEQSKVAPTGRIICDRLDGNVETSSAQLTRQTDVLTGSAHPFIDPDTCKPLVRFSTCKFFIDGQSGGYELRSMPANGYKDCRDTRPDWAIFVLKQKIPGAHAYPVDENVIRNLKKNDKLLSVGLSRDFPERKRHKIVSYPKHEAHCAIRDIFSNGVMGTDCGAGSGSSGGSCLTDTDHPSLVGVIRGVQETDSEEEWAVAHETTNQREYNKKGWHTSCVPISGDFLKELNRIAPEEQSL